VLVGQWKQKELWNGDYSFEDLLDINSLLIMIDEMRAKARG